MLTAEDKQRQYNNSSDSYFSIKFVRSAFPTFVYIYRQRINLRADVVLENNEYRVDTRLEEVMKNGKVARGKMNTFLAFLVTRYVVLATMKLETLVEWSGTLTGYFEG